MNNTIISSNTAYYRRNKLQKNVIWKCDQCNYTTAGPKICLSTHKYSKHTPENQKPYQCTICKSNGNIKGFAQKAVLNRHLHKTHNIYIKSPGKEMSKYIISLGNKTPTSKKTKARIEWYILQKEITKEALLKKGYTTAQVQYDTRQNYIIRETILKRQL
jgi:hypothetical protein